MEKYCVFDYEKELCKTSRIFCQLLNKDLWCSTVYTFYTLTGGENLQKTILYSMHHGPWCTILITQYKAYSIHILSVKYSQLVIACETSTSYVKISKWNMSLLHIYRSRASRIHIQFLIVASLESNWTGYMGKYFCAMIPYLVVVGKTKKGMILSFYLQRSQTSPTPSRHPWPEYIDPLKI